MTRRALGAVIASLALLTTACGDAAEDAADSGATAVGEVVTDATGEVVETDKPTEAGPTEEATTSGGAGPTVLIGMVGTADDPEAFEITLTSEAGDPITEIPAGDYVIEVTDPAATHNFHLTGGSVDETTSVPEQEDARFEVTLEPGEYTYVCDPHPSMTGTFTVT